MSELLGNRMKIVCINLRSRRDKRKAFSRDMRKQGFREGFGSAGDGEFTFFKARAKKNPKLGCLTSHLSIIRKYYNLVDKKTGNRKYDYLMIFEDDAKFISHLKKISNSPFVDNLPGGKENNTLYFEKEWAMLYLGGTVKDIFDYDAIKRNRQWVRMSCYTTHAYIIRLGMKGLVDDILKASQFNYEIDSFYIDKIHRKYGAYMLNPMAVIQKEGYSDIERRFVNYDFMKDTLKGFQKPVSVEEDGDYVMKLGEIEEKDLPMVSIITPTYCRRKVFALAIRNFYESAYPPEKMEWVIVDNTPVSDKSKARMAIEDIIPKNDKRIKYIRVGAGADVGESASKGKNESDEHTRYSIAKMRNICVENASHSIIIHMDDDDYYPPESVISRVKVLLHYENKGVECVGSSEIGIYDVIHNTSQLASDGQMTMSEASMAYFRRFWETCRFDEMEYAGEYKSFIQGRFDKIMDVPYSFIMIALSHDDNYTGNIKRTKENHLRHKKTNEVINFYDHWDEETRFFMNALWRNIVGEQKIRELRDKRDKGDGVKSVLSK